MNWKFSEQKKTRVVPFLFFHSFLVLSGCSDITERVLENSDIVGTVLNADKNVYYFEDCNDRDNCGDTPIVRNTDRQLVCISPSYGPAEHYDTIYEIPYQTSFTIVQELSIDCSGFYCTGPRESKMVVLEDSMGNISTRLKVAMDVETNDACARNILFN